jgi:ferredoxin-NADP reductase
MRSEEELYWVERLEQLERDHPRFSFHLCLSRAGASWKGIQGRINAHILGALGTFDRPVFYLVGNGNMVRDLKAALLAAGIDRKKQLRQEIFYPATE